MQLQFSVPTFHKTKTSDGIVGPEVLVTVKDDQGVRVVLGDDGDNCHAPDILIERRPRGWLVFLHSDGAADPSGYLFIKDGGKSFVIPGNKFGYAEAIECMSPQDYDAVESLMNQGNEIRPDESDFIDTAEERADVIAEKDKEK